MGEVYKAFDPGLDRTVALKTIRADSDNPEFLDRLYREARACGRLRHPRIVTVHDLGEGDGTVFIAMEYLEGESLAAAMRRGDLTFEMKVNVLIQILDALQYAHTEGVIHRDIKPSNVHMMLDRGIKILDFGLARVARAESLTLSGAIMGTPYYMSPEQLKGQRVDGRTDVYSTGVLAYELFTNRRAFEGETITTVMLKVLSDMPPPMDTAWSATFPEIERIVTRAMAKSVDDRYATAEDMKNALSAFLASSQNAISKTHADVTIQTNRAVLEAKTMIQKGQIAESEALLAQTLKLDPDAKDARALLAQATQVMATPAAGEPVRPVVAAVRPAAPSTKPPPPPPPPHQPAASPRPSTPPAAPPIARKETPAPARPRRAIWFLAPAGALFVFGIVAVVMGQRTAAPALSPQASASSASPGAPAVSTIPAAPAAALAGQMPQHEDLQPSATPEQASLAAAQATAAAPVPNSGGAAPRSRGAAAAAAASRSVFIEAGAADGGLATALANALKARGVAVQSAAAGARVSVRATVQVTVRPSPFQGNSAITADYVGSVQVRNLATNSRQTVPIDGHALDFGEPVARAAAIRAAADQMAEAVSQAVRD